MRILMLLVLWTSSIAYAGVPSVLTSQVLSQAEDDEEGEEEEEDAAPPESTPSAESGVKEEPSAPPATVEPSSQKNTQQLVSGAPLSNPNVAVHIVEKKDFAEKGKHEVVLFPAAAQINGKFTQHYGTAASYVYHLHENFAFQVTGQYNWYASESGFNGELQEKVRQEPPAATSYLLAWGAQGGLEVTPFYGKFSWYEGTLGRFAIVINGGLGVGATRHQLKPSSSVTGPATFGETGLKFLGSLGGGFRVTLNERFVLRLEVRDLVYTARTDSVNGCDSTDLDVMDRALRNGQPLIRDGAPNVGVSGRCRLERFNGVDSRTGYNRAGDVPLAKSLVDIPSSDVLNNVGFYAGLSYLF